MIKSLYKPFKYWSEKGTIWLYSDTHFGDYEDWTYKRLNDKDQLESINSVIGKHDTLIHLGDVGDIEYAKKLKGYKILILGNHDRGQTVYTDIFDEVYSGPLFISDKILLSHEPIWLPFIFNIHGHDHNGTPGGENSYNVCSNVIGYKPLNLDKFIKNGGMSKVKSIHRYIIEQRNNED